MQAQRLRKEQKARHRFLRYIPASCAHEALLLTVDIQINGEENIWRYMHNIDYLAVLTFRLRMAHGYICGRHC
jgi:hypothetical protein